VTAHVTGGRAARQAIEAGVDGLEHGVIGPDEYDVLDLMAERGVVLDPTLSVFWRTAYEGDEMGVFKDGQEAARRILDLQYHMVRAAKQRGVTLTLGTDCVGRMGVGKSALELRLLRESGLSEMDALVAGTRNGGINLGLEKHLGTLEAGKVADILVLAHNPLEDISVLEDKVNIIQIIKSRAPLSASP
jgi:imidazolonepropionase-like amidohydrolase